MAVFLVVLVYLVKTFAGTRIKFLFSGILVVHQNVPGTKLSITIAIHRHTHKNQMVNYERHHHKKWGKSTQILTESRSTKAYRNTLFQVKVFHVQV